MAKLPYKHKMTVIRDTTETLTFSVTNLPSAITGVYFTVKKNIEQDTATFQKSLSSGVAVSGGKYIVTIAPTDTSEITPGWYVYDLKIICGSYKKTLMTGPFEVLKGVTENA